MAWYLRSWLAHLLCKGLVRKRAKWATTASASHYAIFVLDWGSVVDVPIMFQA